MPVCRIGAFLYFGEDEVCGLYQALYRKWRPRSFEDVVSQPHITQALINQIRTGKTAHAYLFTGSRGTGKTTCARIFAKAINCLNPKDGEPCLECEICKAAENGSLADIIEIDGASNSGVADIRELREGVAYTPEMSRYKVYIIDEAHMISVSAFNALLKTMEEPPPHVKFILATTEVHKVPETIVSRCQHFDFGRIKTEDIVARLQYIASKESFTLDIDAATMIARLSDGGMRDALSLLDRCSAYADDITLATVSEASGLSGREHLFTLLGYIADRDTAGAVALVDELHAGSKDLKVLCGELLEQFRNLMLLRSAEKAEKLIVCMPDELVRLKEIAKKMPLDRIFACIGFLQTLNERFARAADKRIETEMCMVRLCGAMAVPKEAGATSEDVSALGEEMTELKARMTELSRKVANGVQVQVQQAQTQAQPPQEQKPAPPPAPSKKFDPDNFTPLAEWQEILAIIEKREPALHAFLKTSLAAIEGNTFCVVVAGTFLINKFKKSNDAAKLKEIVKEYYGREFGFKLYSSAVTDLEDKQTPINNVIKQAEKMKIDVEVKKK